MSFAGAVADLHSKAALIPDEVQRAQSVATMELWVCRSLALLQDCEPWANFELFLAVGEASAAAGGVSEKLNVSRYAPNLPQHLV